MSCILRAVAGKTLERRRLSKAFFLFTQRLVSRREEGKRNVGKFRCGLCKLTPTSHGAALYWDIVAARPWAV